MLFWDPLHFDFEKKGKIWYPSKVMNYLRANYLNTEEFLDAWNGDDNHLFCPTVQELSIGQEIIVELHIPSVHDKTLVRGSVISFRRPVPRRGIRGGALVLVETDELEKVLYLVGLFEQGISKPEKRRKHPRDRKSVV